jgi:DNA-binding SARP family transcriptional activator
MSSLRIFLFGGFQLANDEDTTANSKMTRGVKALLAYLLLFRHRLHAREVLAGLFWGEHSEDRARSCLSTAIWRLRQALEPEGTPKGTYLITTSMGEVGFNQESSHWLDVAEFEERLSPFLRSPSQQGEAQDPGKLQGALELYTGDLLEGFYDDWALRERERLRLLYMKSLVHLMRCYKEHNEYEKSLACGLQILNHDPLREEIHREVMRLYQESGQRAMAIRQYRICSQILEEELGVCPMEETRLLHNQILKASHREVLTKSIPQAPLEFITRGHAPDELRRQDRPDNKEMTRLEQAFHVLSQALHQFERTSEQFRQALRLLESITRSKDPDKPH